MKAVLHKKLKDVTIIQGFPGMGLVSTLSTKFILDHLDFEQVGHIESRHIPPLTAIHKGKIIHPISLFHNKKENLLVVLAIPEVTGMEWMLAETMMKLAKETQAKELVIIEGMPSQEKGTNMYMYTTKKNAKMQHPILSEAVIMGTTAALLLKESSIPITCFFAEAHTDIPDSEAAAKVVEALNKHLGLKVDAKPLFKQAKIFEQKLKQYSSKLQSMQQGMLRNKPLDIDSLSKKKGEKSLEEEEDTSYIG